MSGYEVLVMFEDEMEDGLARWIPWDDSLLGDSEDGLGARSYLAKWGAVARSEGAVPPSLRSLFGEGDDDDAQILPWEYHGDPVLGKLAILKGRPTTHYTRGLQVASKKFGMEIALPTSSV